MREYLHQREGQVQEPAGVRMLNSKLAPLTCSALLLTIMSAAPGWAQWCSEPSAPSCLIFGDPDEWCRLSVERYIRDEREFRQCIIDETNRKIDEAKAKTAESEVRVQRVVSRWNCYASGSTFCP